MGKEQVELSKEMEQNNPASFFERYFGIPLSKVPPFPAKKDVLIVTSLRILSDMLGILLAYLLTYFLRMDILPNLFPTLFSDLNETYLDFFRGRFLFYLLLFSVLLIFANAFNGLYDVYHVQKRTLAGLYFLSNLFFFLLLVLCLWFDKNYWHLRSFYVIFFALNFYLSYRLRLFLNKKLTEVRKKTGRFLFRAVLIGDGDDAKLLMQKSQKHDLANYTIVRQIKGFSNLEAIRANLPDILRKEKATFIFNLMNTSVPFVTEVFREAVTSNAGVLLRMPAYMSVVNPFSYRDYIKGQALQHFNPLSFGITESCFRNVLEKIAAALALCLLAPVFLLIAIAIKLDSKGPIFFLQERYGKDCKRFRMYKFRTMCADAEAKLEALRCKNETDGALFKMKDDPRVTKVGHFLRITSLDELPQLINIMRGEMRFVGPRPLPCADLDPYLEKWQIKRQLVSPGLTCIWQTSGRSEVGFDVMSVLDIWYAHNRSFLLDCQILLRTVWTVLFCRGSY
ncbi:MAG: exopolysaccharide biosynthesis polyprenyl glycosylphosphotransferase [Kiritimatiellia bacterium]